VGVSPDAFAPPGRRPSDVTLRGDDDMTLVERARAGSREAAGELFRRHWEPVWRAAYALLSRRALADDVAQETFVRAFAALDQFDERRPIAPWLKRIAVNRAIDELRSERRLHLVEAEEAAAGESRSERRESEDAVVAAVRRLDVGKRVVVVLHFWLGYSLRQVAELLAVPPGTVASRLSRALDELRADLEVDRANSA
jgi:RNA polymerase sigma-70 factor, ECF subfamily